MNRKATWRARAGLVIAIQGCISIALLILAVTWGGGTPIGVYPLCVVLTALMAWQGLSWVLLTGTLADPYGLFVVVLLAFNGGQAVLEVFGLNRNGLLDGNFSPEVLAGALVLTAASLSWLHTGAVIARILYPPTAPAVMLRHGCVATRRVGWLLLGVGIVPMAFSMAESLRVALSSGYGALYDRDFQTGFNGMGEVLAACVLPGVYFLVAGAGRDRVARVTAAVSIALYSTVRLLIGYRATAVLPLMAFAWLWGRHIGPIPRRKVLCGVFLMVLVFPLVRLTRVQSASDRVDLLNISVLVENVGNPLVDVIAEAGGTLGVAAYVIELVPNERPYDLGVGYLFALSTLVPNLFWDLHPAVANGSYTNWLIRRVNPWIEQRGGSYGFSIVAEAYANFGIVAGPLFLALMAFVFVRFVSWAENGDPARAAALALFLAYWLFVARAESAVVLRPLLWYAVAPYVLTRIVRRGARRAAPDRAAISGERVVIVPATAFSGVGLP